MIVPRMRSMRVGPILIALFVIGCGDAPVEQPLAFNHKVHKEAEIDCGFCHEHFESTRYSGIPTTESCTDCHEDDADTPELARLAEYAAAGEEIPWKRLYAMPSHVFYSHRRHVVAAEIACAECHGAIGELAEPPQHALVDQSMEWCIACHEERNASTDCIHCHR